MKRYRAAIITVLSVVLIFGLFAGSLAWLCRGTNGKVNPYTVKMDYPVLVYHHLVDGEIEPENYGATTTAGKFEEDLIRLKEAGYSFLSTEELLSGYKGLARLPEKGVVIEFDDGYESNFKLAFPILKKHGIKFDIFAVVKAIGEASADAAKAGEPMGCFTWEQAKEMEDSGLGRIYSHGYEHIRSGDLPVETGEDNVSRSLEEIERNLGKHDFMAYSYSYNSFSPENIKSLEKLPGLDMQMASYSPRFTDVRRADFILRLSVHYDSDPLELIDEYRAMADRLYSRSPVRLLRLFYKGKI